ncbi:NAD(P)H-dependent FMN reductasec [Vanrija pseudolonga]|uniref:NAD(P)H-dependent FMN reductasec n=1 Tax=Vanrija pseudolonga TaxID=143232 RepID=A0AAF0YBH7_9TREE|nr:NAD(P)H-dependent FMN reductasec [Vanrija pseudolonga]
MRIHPSPRLRNTRPRVAIVLGSTREPSNTAGLGTYVRNLLRRYFPTVEVEVVHLSKSTAAGHPLPFEIIGTPATHKPPGGDRARLPDTYTHPSVVAWSAAVVSYDAVLFLAPQYNGSITAPLKNALDQLCWEWKGLPAALVTCGGGGGGTLTEHGRLIIGRNFGMDLCDEGVEIALRPALSTGHWVRGDEAWLAVYDEPMLALLAELVRKAEAWRDERDRDWDE